MALPSQWSSFRGEGHEELTRIRAQVSRIEVLEAELATERESSSQLVQWLQETEKELMANYTAEKNTERGSDEMQSTQPRTIVGVCQ